MQSYTQIRCTSYVKKSLGILLFDTKKNKVMVVKKRYTYSYFSFVHAKYDKTNINSVKHLFNMMSIEEKNIIRSHNFDFMWYHIHLNVIKSSIYYKMLSTFNNIFMQDGGTKLDELLRITTYNNKLLYEFPKGRRDKPDEPNICTAIRELYEETNIAFEDFILVPQLKNSISEVRDDVKYITIFYVGIMKKQVIPKVDEININQLAEISDILWMDMDTLRRNVDIDIYNMVKRVSKQLKIRSSMCKSTNI